MAKKIFSKNEKQELLQKLGDNIDNEKSCRIIEKMLNKNLDLNSLLAKAWNIAKFM